MGNVFWLNRNIFSFDDKYLDFFTATCDSMNIKYLIKDNNINLYPAFSNKTIILKSINGNSESYLNSFCKNLEELLSQEGALVLSNRKNIDKLSLEIIDAEILLCFTCNSPQDMDLTIYLPFNNRASISMASKFLKLLEADITSPISYRVASYWEKIFSVRYWNYILNSSKPTVILEIGNLALLKDPQNSLGQLLVNTLLEEFGHQPSQKEVKNIIKLFKEINQRISSDDLEERGKKFNELIQKVQDHELTINEIKSYFKTLKLNLTIGDIKETQEEIEEEIDEEPKDNDSQKTDHPKIPDQISNENVTKECIASAPPKDIFKRKPPLKKNYYIKTHRSEMNSQNYVHSRANMFYPPDNTPIFQFQRPENNQQMPKPVHRTNTKTHKMDSSSFIENLKTLDNSISED